jgi:carboxypeptidase PM20D1
MKKFALFLGLGLGALMVFMVLRTLFLESQQINVDPIQPVSVDELSTVDHLAAALSIRTISSGEASSPTTSSQPFLLLHESLERFFPTSYGTLTKEIVAEKSLLFKWQGSTEALDPILLLAHLDVVPVEVGTESLWTHPPFAGQVKDGYIWGRGALDDKVRVLAIFEAVDMLLKEGFRPERSVYLAFGHDEEVGGQEGASNMAALLKQRSIEFELVLDEGGAITTDLIPAVKEPVALIGIAEKGYLTLELTVTEEGGHSSMPPPHTAIGTLSDAIVRLESHPFASRIDGGTAQFLESLGPAMSFGYRTVLANLWFFSPLLKSYFASQPTTNAMIRTTLATTIFESGTRENILPQQARAVINLRILPGDTLEEVTQEIQRVIKDPRVRVRQVGVTREPSGQSRIDSWGYMQLTQTIRQVFPQVVVAPFVVLGGTDSYHYQDIAQDIYRFSPIVVPKADLKRIHGTDERIAIQDYLACVRFYYYFIRHVST